MTSALRVRVMTGGNVEVRSWHLRWSLVVYGSLFADGASIRPWVPTAGRSRFPSRHRISDAARCLISARVQPARYAVANGGRPVTRIVVSLLETPAPCRVRLAATTSKPCENVGEYRIRLPLPYILRSTPLPGARREKHAGCQFVLTRRYRCRAGTHHVRSLLDVTSSVQFVR
jgi:hypothetical protein